MRTSFLRPNPKDLESRMDLEVSSCLRDCSRGCGTFSSCPSLPLLHVDIFKVKVKLHCRTLCDPMDCSLPDSSMRFSRKNTGVGCHFLLQEIFLTQGLNPGLLYCRQMLYHLSHQGSTLLIRETQIKTKIRYDHKPIRMTKI